MKSLTEIITEKVKQAFEECGYDSSIVKVVLSKQLGVDYQCNSSFEISKELKRNI